MVLLFQHWWQLDLVMRPLQPVIQIVVKYNTMTKLGLCNITTQIILILKLNEVDVSYIHTLQQLYFYAHTLLQPNLVCKTKHGIN